MNKGKDRSDIPPADLSTADTVELELESTSSQTLRGLTLPASSSNGSNPYDSVPGASTATGQHRIADMRRLSEWIRMKRDLERNKK
jgi:hypothetical protein